MTDEKVLKEYCGEIPITQLQQDFKELNPCITWDTFIASLRNKLLKKLKLGKQIKIADEKRHAANLKMRNRKMLKKKMKMFA